MKTLCTTVAASMVMIAAAHASECPRKDALGTSRVLAVDPATFPRVGLKSFPQTLPLEDHEVVLTFDDGPWPGTTPKVLAALAHECVLATFFLIGRTASEHPEMVRRMAAKGHTIAHHNFEAKFDCLANQLHQLVLRFRLRVTAGKQWHRGYQIAVGIPLH